MVGDSWAHRAVRPLVRPLVHTPVTPNHLTTVRLASGLGACTAIAFFGPGGLIWGGWLWLLSGILDRADGELARIGGKTSAWGHRYDYFSDLTVTAIFFVAIGVGLRESNLGGIAIVLGLAAAGGVVATEMMAEVIDEDVKHHGDKAYPGVAGFDFDDVLFLFAPIVWLQWHGPFLVGAAVGAPAFAIMTWYRLRAHRRRQETEIHRPGSGG